MTVCEMCGAQGFLVTADVEGVDLKVCKGCSKYGTVKKGHSSGRKIFSKPLVKFNGPELKIVKDYAQKIRSARESKGMSQEDFAKYLNERESVVSKWESGTMRPRIGIARKIAKMLKVNLLEKVGTDKPFEQKKMKSDVLTLGDFKIKIRKKR